MTNESTAKLLLDKYFDKLPGALLNFQFIEESLRMYIAYCYEIISKRVSELIPFKYRYQDLKKDSLGRLLNKFKKLNNNERLIDKIEKLVEDRNYCAHEAYLLTYEKQNDPDYLTKELAKLENIINEAKECVQLLFSEVKKIEERKSRKGKIVP